MRYSAKRLALGGLLIALVALATLVIRIPLPATNGYIHLGDSLIYLIGILFGPSLGALAAGLGSALADILSGYSHWALPTLLVKGLQGFLVGKIAQQKIDKTSPVGRDWWAILVGGLWMIIGYYLAGTLMLADWPMIQQAFPADMSRVVVGIQRGLLAALGGVSGNLLQAIGGAIVALPLIYGLLTTSLLEEIGE